MSSSRRNARRFVVIPAENQRDHYVALTAPNGKRLLIAETRSSWAAAVIVNSLNTDDAAAERMDDLLREDPMTQEHYL